MREVCLPEMFGDISAFFFPLLFTFLPTFTPLLSLHKYFILMYFQWDFITTAKIKQVTKILKLTFQFTLTFNLTQGMHLHLIFLTQKFATRIVLDITIR